MLVYGNFLVVSVFLCLPLQGDVGEQALRTIKALTETHKQSLADACDVSGPEGIPQDLDYCEELALRIAFFYDESAMIARRIGSERGRDAAFYLHMEAARYRMQAYKYNARRQHLKRAGEYVLEARKFSAGGSISPESRQMLQSMGQEVIEMIETHDARIGATPVGISHRVLEHGNSLNSFTPAKVLANVGLAERRQPSRRSTSEKIALAVTGSLTGLFLGASLGMGLSRVRQPFEGLAHRAIYDAAVASWNGGAKVPLGDGVDLCQQGRELKDSGVVRACDSFDRLGRATIATGVLAGVSLATTIALSVKFSRSHRRSLRIATGWQAGGVVFSFSGHF